MAWEAGSPTTVLCIIYMKCTICMRMTWIISPTHAQLLILERKAGRAGKRENKSKSSLYNLTPLKPVPTILTRLL